MWNQLHHGLVVRNKYSKKTKRKRKTNISRGNNDRSNKQIHQHRKQELSTNECKLWYSPTIRSKNKGQKTPLRNPIKPKLKKLSDKKYVEA